MSIVEEGAGSGQPALAQSLRQGVRHEAGFLSADDGTRLFWQSLAPQGRARAAVALVHGFNSFSDWQLPLMERLAREGLSTYAMDYRGHGLSEGVPCHVLRFREYLSDVRALCRHVMERVGGEPIFLVGTSLGGLIVSHYALRHPECVRGVVLLAPFFGPAFRIPRALDPVVRVCSYWRPALRVPRGHPDLPVYTTFRWWTETLTAQAWFRQQAERFRPPALVLHGALDQVASPEAAAALVERLGSRDKTFRLLPELGHRDLDPWWGADWWQEVTTWISERVSLPATSGRSPTCR